MKKNRILFLAVLMMLLALPLFSVPRVEGVTFNTPQSIEQTAGSSDYPSALQASDGTIWVAWQQYYETGVYMTYTSGAGWSPILTLPTATPFVISPSLAQMRNSSIILLWSSNQTGHWNIYYKLYSSGAWRNTIRLTSGTSFDDFFPEAAVTTNSTVYVFWERYFSSTSVGIYYKALKGNTWSADIQVSSSGHVDATPAALATYDGKVWVAWARQSSSNYNLYYRNYNGVSWSAETQLTTNNYDIDPGMVQDRNGTIWIFWSRQIQLAGGTNALYQQKLFYKTTFDGSAWSSDVQLTSYGDVNNPLDDYSPTVLQGVDKSLWIFYSSDYPSGFAFDIYYIKSSTISSVHNAIITGVRSGPNTFQKSVATILVTVTNLGDFAETVQITVTATNTTTYTIASSVTKSIPLGGSVTFSFSWNTTSVPLGRYVITASYPRFTGQSFLASGGDTMQFKVLTILPPFKTGHCHNLRDCPT